MRLTLWTLALGLALTGRPVKSQETQTADPPGTAGIMARYRLWFALADTNKDGMLDKEELARAFRGPYAKPFDYVPPPKPVKDKKDDKDDKDKTEKTDEKDTTAAADKDKSEKDKPVRKRDYSAYVDYLFLTQLDVNHDETISREEFDSWARDVSVQIKNQLELQAQLLQLQLRLQQDVGKLNSNDRKKLEADLKRQSDQLARAQQQLQKMQKHFTQARRKTN